MRCEREKDDAMTFLHRRQLLRGLAAGGGAALLAGGDFGPVRTGSRAAAHAATPGVGGDYAMEVDAGLAYFQRRAAELTPLVETLAHDLPNRAGRG